MIKKKVTVTNKLGLHLRPCTQIVRTAQKYTSSLNIQFNQLNVNAKSMLDLMQLAAEKGSELELIADGVDARQLIKDIAKLFQDNFGE